MTNYKHDPRILDMSLRRTVESWWMASLLLKLGVFVAGVISTVLTQFTSNSPFVIVLLTILSEFCLWRSERIRDAWEKLHRNLDFNDSLGWPLPKIEFSDLMLANSRKIGKLLSTTGTSEIGYFGSKQPQGPNRAVENVQESAWWAKHIAKRASVFYTGIIILLIIISTSTFILSIEAIKSFNVLSNISRVVTSLLMLIFSLDLLRMAYSYWKYSEKASSIEEQAERLLNDVAITESQAIKLIQEYHLAHVQAPLNPSWIWKLMRNDLNELWAAYRQK